MLQQRGTGRDSFLKKTIAPYLMVAPAMAFLLVFTFYPMVNLVYLSLFDYNLVNPVKKYVGLKNYNTLFARQDFLVALKNTAVYTGAVVILLILLALLLALWTQKDRPLNRFVQTATFTPHLVAMLSCAMIWAWIMDHNTYGLLNVVLGFFRIPPLRWLNSSATAMLSVVIVSVWKSIGYYTIIIMSALKAVPTEIYEAAELDNAPKIRTFFRITLPLLSPQLFFLLITITISSFKVFDTIRVMTGGGPGNSTDVISYYIYRYAFSHFRVGYASAAGTVLMVILMIMTAVYFQVLSKRVHYQ
mgnify:CR=1 FL=1